MLTIFYGAAGVGKNYIGSRFAKQNQYHFYDADQDLTDEMKERIKQKLTFTQSIRDQYFSFIADKISKLFNEHPNIVVTQAFSQESNRQQIKKKFPNAMFCCIESSLETQLQNIRERNNEIDATFVAKLNLIQQPPSMGDFVIQNTRNNKDLDKKIAGFLSHIKNNI
jgi:shikimate kinase